MSPGETGTREGRQVSASEGTGGKSGRGIIPVRIKALALDAEVHIGQFDSAYALISGEGKDEVAVTWENGIWTLTWPEQSSTRGYGTQIGNHNVQHNVQHNVFQGRHFQNITFSRDSYASGRDMFIGGDPAEEAPAVKLFLPSGCSLVAEVGAGSAYVPAPRNHRHGLNSVSFKSQSADLTTDCAVGTLSVSTMSGDVTARGITGPVNVSTMSGDIDIDQAMGVVQARTMSGDVEVTALDSVMVTATATSGDVTVHASRAARPMVNASSVSGRVRQP